jgi:hypothetical protein
MIIQKIGVAYERKFNLGNYEHCQLAAHVWAGVEQGDDIDDCFNLLFDIAKEKVKDNVPPSYKAHTPNYTETFSKYGKKVDNKSLINTAASVDEDFDPVGDHKLGSSFDEVLND